MFSMLFRAAVILLAIFNNVEAGCFHSGPACDDGEIHGEEAPSEHDWIFNMGVLWQGTHDNICAGAGIKPANRDDPVKVVTTASCIEKIQKNAVHLALIGGQTQMIDLTREGPNQNLFVHKRYRSAEETPKYDIAVVKFPRNGYLQSELDNWIELPPQGHRPSVTTDYSGAFYAYQNSEYHLAQKDRNVAVVHDRRCGPLVEESRGALFCVYQFLTNAVTGAPLYRIEDQRIVLVGLHQHIAGANLDRFISVGRHADWIRGI